MQSVSNSFYHMLSRFISLFFTGFFGVYSVLGGFKTPPETPSDFTPVLRFAVCSDVHLNGDPEQAAAIRMGQLFDDAYAYAQTTNYKSLDAVLVVGDFATNGKPEEYQRFNEIVAAHKKGNTQILTVLGSFRCRSSIVAYESIEQNSRTVLIASWTISFEQASVSGKTFPVIGSIPILKFSTIVLAIRSSISRPPNIPSKSFCATLPIVYILHHAATQP